MLLLQNGDINASAAITLTKLGTGALPTTITVASANLVDGTIVDADINAAAAITKTKISGTAITAADTGTVTSTMILDGTILNADVNASAGITAGKLAGVFTTSSGANKTITISASAPTGGADGDIWFKY